MLRGLRQSEDDARNSESVVDKSDQDRGTLRARTYEREMMQTLRERGPERTCESDGIV